MQSADLIREQVFSFRTLHINYYTNASGRDMWNFSYQFFFKKVVSGLDLLQRFRGGLVFKAHRLLYHATVGLRVIKKKEDLLGVLGRVRDADGGWDADASSQVYRSLSLSLARSLSLSPSLSLSHTHTPRARDLLSLSRLSLSLSPLSLSQTCWMYSAEFETLSSI